MNWTLNRLSILISVLVLAGILLLLSIFYFHEKESVESPQGKNTAEVTKEPRKPRPKLTEEEKEKIRLRREAERTGQTSEELEKAVEDPQKQIDREAQRIQGLTDDEARSELVRKKRQLEKIQMEDLEQIMETVSPENPEVPKRETTVLKKVEADQFDADTAQIDDCRMTQDDDGTVRYFATLVDAAGNSIEVEMKGKEGERTYRTMRMIKNNPLMELLYRGSVMPAMDRKLEQEEEQRKRKSVEEPENFQNSPDDTVRVGEDQGQREKHDDENDEEIADIIENLSE